MESPNIFPTVWLTILIMSGFISPVYPAAQLRSACNAWDGILDSGTSNVVSDDPKFQFDNKPYPINVFSLASTSAWTSNFICLRYEVENVGSDPIPLLYW